MTAANSAAVPPPPVETASVEVLKRIRPEFLQQYRAHPPAAGV